MTPLALEAREMDELIDFIVETIRRAILTLAVMPAQRGPKEYGSTLDSRMVRGWEGYGDHEYAVLPKPARVFQPTPADVSRCLVVMGWFAWYGHNESRMKADCFYAWTMGAAQQTLARRYRVDRKTVERWRKGLARSVIGQFPVEVAKIQLDARPKCPTSGGIHKYDGDLRPEAPADLPVTPAFVRSPDATPVHLPESRDHKRTLKRLDKNARKSNRAKADA